MSREGSQPGSPQTSKIVWLFPGGTLVQGPRGSKLHGQMTHVTWDALEEHLGAPRCQEACQERFRVNSGSPHPWLTRLRLSKRAYFSFAVQTSTARRYLPSTLNPPRCRRQPPACGIISRSDIHFMHFSILDMQIACPDMTLVMS